MVFLFLNIELKILFYYIFCLKYRNFIVESYIGKIYRYNGIYLFYIEKYIKFNWRYFKNE